RQNILQILNDIQSISIHVPAWGTTSSSLAFSCIAEISIHVPAWGTTSFSPKAMLFHSDFNPRSRVGNDRFLEKGSEIVYNFNPRPRVGNDSTSLSVRPESSISIHVPAWGTTPAVQSQAQQQNVFQSTFPRGERRLKCVNQC